MAELAYTKSVKNKNKEKRDDSEKENCYMSL